MLTLKYLRGLMLQLFFIVVLISCGSQGAILDGPDTVDIIDEIKQKTLDIVSGAPKDAEVVFHRAGSFQEYAKNVNKADFKYDGSPLSVKDVATLMDRSFGELKADSIEIDAQTVNESQSYRNVYIVHDEIDEKKLTEMAKNYLANNTLEKVIDHFIQKKYFFPKPDNQTGKHLYIELKIPKKHLYLNHSPLSSAQKQYIEKIIGELKNTINTNAAGSNTSTAIRRQIGFASFNLYALEYAHDFSKQQGQDGYHYYFIAATNLGLRGYLANVFFSKEINYLDEKLKKRLISHDWLSGIWFDPAGIKRIADTFNTINSKRESPLMLYISTYKLKREKFFEKLRKEFPQSPDGQRVKLENVRGLFFDIQIREH